MAHETIELSGHIVDSLLLAKVLDTIVEAGVAYDIAEVTELLEAGGLLPLPHPRARHGAEPLTVSRHGRSGRTQRP